MQAKHGGLAALVAEMENRQKQCRDRNGRKLWLSSLHCCRWTASAAAGVVMSFCGFMSRLDRVTWFVQGGIV